MVKPPLAKGDDGSGNRYPVRQAHLVSLPCERHSTPLCMSPACAGLSGSGITLVDGVAYLLAKEAHERHELSGVAHADCHWCVPLALRVETPERHEIPCLGDES